MSDYAGQMLSAHFVSLGHLLAHRKGWKPDEVEHRLRWKTGRYREILDSPASAPVSDCFSLFLFALQNHPSNPQITPADSLLPDAFFQRRLYHDRPTLEPPKEEVNSSGRGDATLAALNVTGVMLHVASALQAEGCLNGDSMADLLKDYTRRMMETATTETATTETSQVP